MHDARIVTATAKHCPQCFRMYSEQRDVCTDSCVTGSVVLLNVTFSLCGAWRVAHDTWCVACGMQYAACGA